ncbi:MarR family winged helix-turn-helix transcriptional regulator [Pseudonocardia alaniniphila]|uniref:MarR family transcriptional regulator n=1 Tax=Pseudonocardia alaniniphila TaxID=75291 RepID=A0ABS9TRM1_9PSEU|nr:MarR family transcriptional regulator [Pseudonocardia alaniniphila]MCH6171176.1 MarR family transcriptional regulator [Pseudonocardia alaniniphila]
MPLPPRTALEAIYEVVMATIQRAEPALTELGLTMSTTYALWAIDPDEPPPAMKVVAQRLRCTSSSLTFTSNRLVELGYITRTECPTNRRTRVLALTPPGRAAREAALNALDKACPLLRLSDGERAGLLDVLTRALAEAE